MLSERSSVSSKERSDSQSRTLATVIVKVASVFSFLSAVLVPVVLMSAGDSRNTADRVAWSMAAAFNGVFWWAACHLLARVSEETRELHRQLMNALK